MIQGTDSGRFVLLRDSGRELGTSYDVELVVPPNTVAGAERALAAARDRCHALEQSLSEWREDSDLSALNRAAGREAVPVDASMQKLLSGANHVARVTGGAFDFAWAPLGVLWDAAERRGRLPDAAELAEARRHVGFANVILDRGRVRFKTPEARLGVASFAKGWIIDSLFHGLRASGFPNALVNIGGDLRCSGHDVDGGGQVFQVIDPYVRSNDTRRVAAELGLTEGAVATSGNYVRRRRIGGVDCGHVFDPATGYPAVFDGSVTVLAQDAAMADALATALFVMGPEKGMGFARRVPGLEVLFLTRRGPVATDGLVRGARFLPPARGTNGAGATRINMPR